MRVHCGIVPGGGKKGQTSLVIVEHREVAPSKPGGKVELEQVVVHVERQAPILETVRDRIIEIATQTKDRQPCFFIDATGGMGAGLIRILFRAKQRGEFPQELHAPHAYTKRGVARQGLVNAIVTAYGTDRLGFAKDLPLRTELTKALTTYETHVSDDGRLSYGGEEEMVIAMALALSYKDHGPRPRYVTRDGRVVADRAVSNDPYLF